MWSAYPGPDLLDFGTPCKKLANGSELSWGRGGGGGKGGKVCIEGKRSWWGGGQGCVRKGIVCICGWMRGGGGKNPFNRIVRKVG